MAVLPTNRTLDNTRDEHRDDHNEAHAGHNLNETHRGLSTTAHGGIVATSDPRLSDARPPTDTSVTTAKLVDGAVTAAKLADGAVSAVKVAADVATQAELDTVAQTLGVRSRITTFPYSFVNTDAGTFKDFDSATAVQVRIPTAATFGAGTPMVVGTAFVTLCQMGAGQVEVVPESGVTLESRGGVRKLAGPHAVATLHRRSTDVWVLSGDIVA